MYNFKLILCLCLINADTTFIEPTQCIIKEHIVIQPTPNTQPTTLLKPLTPKRTKQVKQVEKEKRTRYNVPYIGKRFVSYMDYRAVTNTQSEQWRIIQLATVKDGYLYSPNNRVLIALGSVFGAVGTKVDIVFEDGRVLKAIKADEKADADTVNGFAHASDGSVVEAIIDKNTLSSTLLSDGDLSIRSKLFSGSIKEVYRVE